ncbi:MAG: DNA-3-methyladenine glycosylase 1 [Candidatus Lokiarchaeum sp. GC14_75]|nr:MAG: DNA-3-methyladenine glycosylase 1 [Candidatus Lokiarchaeum sp. GC14_75]
MYQKVTPPKKKPKDNKGYFEVLSKAVFNAGFSYQVVNNKWEGIKEVFQKFDPDTLSNWTVDEISDALSSPKIIRNARKVNAIVSNAKVFLKLLRTHGSFENYLKSFQNEPYEEKQKILSKKFKWLGPTGAHFFLWSVGEDAPPCEEVIKLS